jgi:hypothetical protein
MLQDKGVTIAQVRVPDGTSEITQVKALAGQADIQQENPHQSPSTPLIATRIRRIFSVETRMNYLIP